MSVISENHNFHLIYGNRLDFLAGKLAEKLSEPAENIFNSEMIVVQSGGMARWLSMQLAKHNGIAANFKCPFPKAFINEYLFRPLAAATKIAMPVSTSELAWKIFELLPRFHADGDEFIRQYLQHDADGLRRIQIAEKLADLLDNYALFRPDWVEAWRGNRPCLSDRLPDCAWQRALWHQLNPETFSAFYRLLLEQIYPEIYPKAKTLPVVFEQLAKLRRVFFFGFTTLPPAYLDIIYAASKVCEVNLYYLVPCREQIWEEYRSGKQVARQELARMRRAMIAGEGDDAPPVADDAEQFVNPLLRDCGGQGREFFQLVNSLDEAQREDCFCGNDAPPTLLSRIQQDVLEAREPGAGDFQVAADDFSLRIGSCHSLMRETEILRDFLLDCFKRLPNLKPHEIMVLVPDMAKYAPYLDAVFKNLPPDEPGYFFATIADIRQRYGVESGALAGFLKIASGRFTVMEVLALLEVPAVFAKFGISDDEMPLLRNWIRGTNIKWGIDADFRKETLGVEFDANSWRAGLARLQASFAFGSLGDDAVPVFADGASGDIAVSAMVPEASAALLGKFSEFMEELFALRERLLESGVARNAEYWRDFALDVIRLFFSDEEPHTAAVQGLRDSVCRALIAPPGMEFSRVVFEYLLAAEFDRTVSTGGFLRGGVTFCEMKALRSLPARVICLLGMNEGDFPRLSFRDSLDLIGQGGARLGDHSLRADDRAQFLESLISARDVFYLSYLGQDIKDNCELPPSVLVSELLDYLVRYDYLPPCGFKSIGDFVQLKHPLHPFSRRYFDGSEPNLHSYSQKNLVAAKKNAERAPDARRIFCQVPLPPPSFDDGILPLSSLIEFYKNPAKYFLRHRLNVNPEVSAESEFDASEPMDVKAFEIYQIKQDLLDVMLSGDEKQISAKRRALCCSGDLPPCSLGQAQLAEVCATARSVADKIAHITKNTVMALGAKENFVVDYVLPPENIISQLPITLEGYFPRIFIADGGATLVLGRCAKIKEKDRTAAQISRLAANLGETPVAAKLVGEDGVEDYPACGKEAARAALQVLLDYYVIGMTRPLPFFPVASQEYCGRIVKNNDMDEALRAAQTVWTGSEYRGAGEADDRCIQLCFNGVFPDVDEFVEISQKVCAALNGEVE